jgi:alpha-mannosidase
MKLKGLAIAAIVAATISAEANAQQKVDTTQFKPQLYFIANAHLDTQWRWTVQQVIGEFLPNTFLQNFSLMEQYPDYKFSFEGAVKYLWAKEYYPSMYETLKKYIANGRWYPAGASWDANDYNVPSAESNFKNILLAEEFYKKEFGIKSYDIMLPDCFGFGYTLPTVAAHCGVVGFHTQKLEWRYATFYPGGKKWPFEFGQWQGIDGQSILAIANGYGYSWNPNKDIYQYPEIADIVKASPVKAAFRYFGTRSSQLHGDQGGSPLPIAVKCINESKLHGGPYAIKFSTPYEYFKDFGYLKDSGFLPTFRGELLMDTHGTGGYSSSSDLKRLNRRSEQLGVAAESGAAMADWLGAVDYPQYQLTEAYRRFMWHQFHDDLPGTCIVDAYTFTWNDQMLSQNQFASIIGSSVAGITTAMDTKSKAGIVTAVYNPVSAANKDIVTLKLNFPSKYRSVKVIAPNGRTVPSQIISRDKAQAIIAFAPSDPSMSVNIYDIIPQTATQANNSGLKVEGNEMENAIYKLKVNDNGDICSLIDKRNGKELVKKGQAFSLLAFPNDKSDNWPAWEILKSVIDQKPVTVNQAVKISTESEGPLMAILKIEKSYGSSKFTQRIILTSGAEDDRIDIKTNVDWQSMNTLLKASFPFSFAAKEASYDLGLGFIKRGNNTDQAYEVPAQEWADMTSEDGSCGVTIMNDCKYGWDKPNDNTLRLTLLHTPSASNDDYSNQQTQDIGPHEFTYSIVAHTGALDGGTATAKADILNQRKSAFLVTSHDGTLGKSFSFLETSSPEIRVKAFKKAEDGDGYIVRIYELSGNKAEGKIRFNAPIVSAEETNGIEETKGPAVFSGKELSVSTTAFSPKTYRVRFAKPTVSTERPDYESIPLEYNNLAITSDAFSAFGHFDKDWHSYSAELIPETIVHKGIPFKMGTPDLNNALACKGQTLNLPSGTTGVYMLVASSEKDTTATFVTKDHSVKTQVPYFSGFFGGGNWKGQYSAFLKKGDVAYVGSHRHDSRKRNEVYVHTYMYMIFVPIEKGTMQVTLPNDVNVKVFAATAIKGELNQAEPATEMVTVLIPNK